MSFRIAALAAFLLETALIIALFWRYGNAWGDQAIFFVVLLIPLFLMFGATYRRVTIGKDNSPQGGRFMLGGCFVGVIGGLLAMIIGPHGGSEFFGWVIVFQMLLFVLAYRQSKQTTGNPE